MSNAKRDDNRIPTLLAVSSVDGVTPVVLYADPITHRLYVDLAAGSGTVTDVSVVSANGFAGTVATSTTTPAITLSTTITGILKGNGIAISAASDGTDYLSSTTGLKLDQTSAQTIANGSPIISSLTASKVVFTDASKKLTSTGIGTSSQFIKGDGSLDSTTYSTTTGTVTSITSGNGMNFTTITSTGTVTLGTPSSITSTSTNATTTTSHTHAIDSTIITSGSSPTFATVTTTGNIELGNASDTTLARVSAGVISVEGVRVITSSGTTSGTILKNNGTTFVASTETYAAPGTSGNVMTSDGTNWVSSAPTTGSSFWTLMPGTPTRASNTTFTITGDYSSLIAKGMIIKWTESGTVRNAMVSIPSTYSNPNTTITIIGDTMASIDASSLKYAMIGAEMFMQKFAIAGTIGATGTDIANAYYATEPMRVIGADLQTGTAGTTNSTTIDINKGGTTMFTTKPTLATTVASSPTPFTADTATSLALGDKVTIDVDAVQTTAAIDLYAQLYLFPTRYNNLN